MANKLDLLNKPAAAPAAATPPAVHAGSVNSILPPDAPSRESTPEEIAAVEEQDAKASKRGKKTAVPVTTIQAPSEPASFLPDKKQSEISNPTGPAKRPRIYIRCGAIKGEKLPVALEDWIAPIQVAAADVNEGRDVREIAFQQGKVLYAEAVRRALPTCPDVISVSTYGWFVDEALAVLIPHAEFVVRGWGG